jgi:class 3 adenylate cyclase
MVWFEADNLYAVFPTARDAVQASLAAQATMAAANAKRKHDERLEICIGVGAGRLLRIGTEDVYGDQMNLASKLGEDTAKSGDIFLTEAAWNDIAEQVEGLDVELQTIRISGVEIPYRSVKATPETSWR